MKLLLAAAGFTAAGFTAALVQSWPTLAHYYLKLLGTDLTSTVDSVCPTTMDIAGDDQLVWYHDTELAFNHSPNASVPDSEHFLSIEHSAARAAETAAMAAEISNELRTWRVGGEELPSYAGPVARPGSLAERLQYEDLMELSTLKPDTPELMAALAVRWLPQLDSPEAYTSFYELFTPVVDAPLTGGYNVQTVPTDRHAGDVEADVEADVAFGAERLSLRGFNLRAVRSDDVDPEDETLTAANVAAVCGAGATIASLRADHALFVVDLSTMGQWGGDEPHKVEIAPTQLRHPRKYLPSVRGYFCFNRDGSGHMGLAGGHLRPLAITLVDSGLTYTPFDSRDEWLLAKTALNAAEATFQQMQHFAESHTLSIPIRVELYRAMAARHPVRALLLRHFALDFGLEQQAGVVLFNDSTPLDLTFGLGASGCVRFLHAARANISLSEDLREDLRARGIAHLPHKYAAYGRLHHEAITKFVTSFLDVYYVSDAAVQQDVELQHWAAACARVPHLHSFPAALEDKTSLSRLLTRLIFQSAVKHHAMNGEVTWHTVAMPFSAPALWRPLPNRKVRDGHTPLELFSYLQPRELFPTMVFLTALFNRPRPEDTTLESAYSVAPFNEDPRLRPAIAAFDHDLQALDAFILANEQHETRPYHVLRPGSLPHNTWI